MYYASLVIHLLCKIQEELEIFKSPKQSVIESKIEHDVNHIVVSSKHTESYEIYVAGTPLKLQQFPYALVG